MSNMGNCKDCTGCTCDGEQDECFEISRAPSPLARTPIEEFLRPVHAPHMDDTPLGDDCTCHEPVANTARYKCMQCLESYARAVGYEQAYLDADRYESVSKIAAAKLREIADDLKHKRRLGPED